MKMKMQLLNLHYGNRGLIFSLDIALAVIVVTIILSSSIIYLKADDFSDTQLLNIGYDILAVLDHNNVLDTLNKNNIENSINNILPLNYNIKIKVDCDSKVVETSGLIPANKDIFTGQRVFVTDNLDYCIANFWIWLR